MQSFRGSLSRIPARCRVLSVLGFVFLSIVGIAEATNVQFTGGTYTINGTSVTLSMTTIENFSSTASGDLRMELWAFSSPYTGQPGAFTNGYRLAVSPSLGSLQAGSRFTTSPIEETVPILNPPNGTYYLTLFLTEFQAGAVDDGYVSVSFANFSDAKQFESTGAAFGFSSAVPVGGGFYYDADVSYIYPFDNGIIYLSDLNRFYFVDPGTDFVTGVYIYDFSRSAWTYTQQSIWPYVYYFDGTGFVSTGFH